MPDRYEEVEKRLKAISPGFWYSSLEPGGYFVYACQPCSEIQIAAVCGGEFSATSERADEDSDFIANAPSDLRWCLKEIKRLREVLEAIDQVSACRAIF